MRTRLIFAVWMASVAATFGVAATANAGGAGYQFQSPSGNIACVMGTDDGKSTAGCDIGDHTYAAPPTPPDCHLGWGDRFSLEQGSVPALECHGDTLRVPGLPTLGIGQTRSVGTITCDSEAAGMTCTDHSTGHFFRVTPGAYQLG